MNKEEAYKYINKVKRKYFDCSTPKCGENGLCWDCNELKHLIKLFAYIENIENVNMKLKQENLNLKQLNLRNSLIENDPELSDVNKHLLELAGLK